jgi:hypothetical protein
MTAENIRIKVNFIVVRKILKNACHDCNLNLNIRNLRVVRLKIWKFIYFLKPILNKIDFYSDIFSCHYILEIPSTFPNLKIVNTLLINICVFHLSWFFHYIYTDWAYCYGLKYFLAYCYGLKYFLTCCWSLKVEIQSHLSYVTFQRNSEIWSHKTGDRLIQV